MFKNESDVVAKKAEKRYEELAKQEAPTTSKRKGKSRSNYDSAGLPICPSDKSYPPRSSNHLVPYARYSTPETFVVEIAPSIEEQAQGFFISNYVAQPAIVPRGQFEWVTELLAQPDTEEVLRSSVNAASLAGLATSTKSPVIMQKAQAAYVSALRVTNSALRVKETAIKDSTLISVIMLGMYENMVSQDSQSMQAWAKHVAGACALLNLRGKEQFEKSEMARRIFHQFYGVVLLVALETGTMVHEGMHELYESLHPTSDYEVHGRQWTTRVVNVIHDAINLSQDKQSSPVVMVRTALAIDRELSEIKSLMPSIWHYETVYLEQPSEYQYGDCYHVYLDPWIAQMWNNLRSCRMYLYKIMRENATKACELYDPPLFSEEEIAPQREAAVQVMRTTAAHVIASVPQITGMIPFPSRTSPKSKNPLAPEQERQTSKYTLHPPGTFLDRGNSTGMVHLIWPVYAVGQSDLATPELRQWCIETLHNIALQIGTRQAVVLADELKATQRSGTRPSVAQNSDCFFNRVTLT
ncbi:Nn.00g101230.m01.CDS01 [Neocucurbitaria sp. VM-36]